MKFSEKKRKSIGEERESSLHHWLKMSYWTEGAVSEAPVGDYIADVMTKKGDIVEIQTGNFASIKKKLEILSKNHKILLVHPLIAEKYIEVYDTQDNFVSRRKSPKKSQAWELFRQLVHAPLLPALPGLTIELAFIAVREKRRRDGRGSWHRKGDSIIDKEILRVIESKTLRFPQDYRAFLPYETGEEFSAKDLAAKAKIPIYAAQKALYCLTKLGITKRRKQGRAYLYSLRQKDLC
jgi:hypothetical protein